MTALFPPMSKRGGATQREEYKDVSQFHGPEIVAARRRFGLLPKEIPLPDENDPFAGNA